MNPQCKLDASNFSSIKSSKEQLEEWRRQLGSELFVRVEWTTVDVALVVFPVSMSCNFNSCLNLFKIQVMNLVWPRCL